MYIGARANQKQYYQQQALKVEYRRHSLLCPREEGKTAPWPLTLNHLFTAVSYATEGRTPPKPYFNTKKTTIRAITSNTPGMTTVLAVCCARLSLSKRLRRSWNRSFFSAGFLRVAPAPAIIYVFYSLLSSSRVAVGEGGAHGLCDGNGAQ